MARFRFSAATFCGGLFSAFAQSTPTALQTVVSEPEAAQANPGVAASVEATSDWLTSFTNLVDTVDGWVWGVPLIGAVLVTGLILTFCLRLNHVFNLKRAFQYMFHQEEGDSVSGEVSSFGALCANAEKRPPQKVAAENQNRAMCAFMGK